MAINPSELQEFSGRITPPSPDFPYGSARNDSTGTAGDGTPITKPLLDDIFGLQQYFLSKESITPSGTADNAQVSQVAQAMLRAISRNVYNPDINYPVHARVIDGNGDEKRCGIANGPATTVVSPVNDATGTWIDVFGVRVTASGTNSNGSYRVWSDGTIEQWGRMAVQRDASAARPFPIPYVSAIDVVNFSLNSPLIVTGQGTMSWQADLNTLTLHNGVDTSGLFGWHSIGR